MEPKIQAPKRGASFFYHWEKKSFICISVSPFEIGRRMGECQFPDDRMISRQHCQLEFSINSTVVTITDMESQNGTYVNGKKIAAFNPVELKQGDWVRVGQQHFFYTREQTVPDVSQTMQIPGYLRRTTPAKTNVSATMAEPVLEPDALPPRPKKK